MKRKALWLAAAALVLGLVTLAVAYPRRAEADHLRDPNPAVRAAAVRATHSPAELVGALRDENSDVRLLAARRLQWRKDLGDETVRALVGALKDRHAGVRREAAKGLGFIGPPAWPAVRDALRDPDPRVRAGAAFAVEWGPGLKDVGHPGEAETFTPLLQSLAEDDAPEVRRAAVDALGSVGRRGR